MKVLFDKLPAEIQKRILYYLVTKAPEYSDVTKCENELLIMSETFVQWRYSYEGKGVPAFDSRFLSAFANTTITVMFELGYNVFFTSSTISQDTEKYAEIDAKIAQNRKEFLEENQKTIQKKKKDEQK